MAKEQRIKIKLKCTECGKSNYTTEKNRIEMTEKLVLKKYCPRCLKHTKHTEIKVK